jgi:histidinol-phosphate aminotransferase
MTMTIDAVVTGATTQGGTRRARGDDVCLLPDPVNPLALSLNESPFPPLPAVRSALIDSVDAANRYPEFRPDRLRALIAAQTGVDSERIVIGAGATGLIMSLLSAVTTPGDAIAVAIPTYDGYPISARIAGLRMNAVELDDAGHHDLDALADAAAHSRVVVVCRPHNPTGTIEQPDAIERFLQRVPGDTVVLLDEAYVEFLSAEYRLDSPALVERFPNLFVVRTFSKAYGLAGLRIGYGFCAPQLAATLWAMQLPFPLGICSTVAVAASYNADSQLRQRIQMITDERRYLQSRLHRMGIHSTDSHANFLYLPGCERPWRPVFDGTGLQVRHYPDGAVRIAVGRRPSSHAVVTAITGAGAGTRYSRDADVHAW